MEKLKFLNSKDIKKINLILKSQWDVELPKGKAFLITERNRIYMVNRDIDKINDLKFDSAGLYFGTYENNSIRLSIEGSQILGPLIKINLLDLNEELFKKWLSGEDLDIKSEMKGPVIIKFNNDYCGCGISTGNIVLNFVPKERRSIFN